MRIVTYAIVFLGLVVLQTTVVNLLAIKDVQPDGLLLALIYLALREGSMPAIVAGFSVGLLEDFLSTGFIGLTALSKSIAGYVAGLYYGRRPTLTWSWTVLVVFSTAFVHDIVHNFTLALGKHVNFFYLILASAFPGAVYTTVVAFIIHNLLPKRMLSVPHVVETV